MVHFVSGWTRGVQVKLWDPLRTRAIPERLGGVFTTRRCTNTRLPLPLPLSSSSSKSPSCCVIVRTMHVVWRVEIACSCSRPSPCTWSSTIVLWWATTRCYARYTSANRTMMASCTSSTRLRKASVNCRSAPSNAADHFACFRLLTGSFSPEQYWQNVVFSGMDGLPRKVVHLIWKSWELFFKHNMASLSLC